MFSCGGFHRIRHFGRLANTTRRENLAKARALLGDGVSRIQVPSTDGQAPMKAAEPERATFVCSHCGAAMLIVETFLRVGQSIRAPPVVKAGS